MLGNIISVQLSPDGALIQGRPAADRLFTVYKGTAREENRASDAGKSRMLHHILLFDDSGVFSPGEKTHARVMAVAECGSRIYYICAADGTMLFAPVIREVLEGYEDFAAARMTCLYEKSCGAVIFRRHSGNVEYLLVKNKKGSNWGFPKGHMEMHESERQTATREVREETGLNVRLLDGFRTISEYHPKGRIIKQVIFFVAEMPDENVVIQPSEIERFIWADYSLAIKTFKFSNDKKVLTQAKSWLADRLY